MIKKKTTEQTAIDKAIEEAYTQLAKHTAGTDEHNAIVKQIVEFEKILAEKKKSRTISPDTMLIVGANIVGILLVLNFEKADVITSKAFGLIGKLK